MQIKVLFCGQIKINCFLSKPQNNDKGLRSDHKQDLLKTHQLTLVKAINALNICQLAEKLGQ